LFIYLTPFIPLSFKGEGEIEVFEGVKPLQNSLDKQPLSLGIDKRGVYLNNLCVKRF